MKHERVTEEVRELAALYALGALTQHEAHSFEIHLTDCPVCKSELNRLEHAVAGIGLAVEEIETPEYLRDLLLARIDREPPVSVSLASPDPKAPDPKEPALNALFQIAATRTNDIRRKSKFDWPVRIALIVLALACLVSFFYLYSIRALNAQLQAQLSVSKTEMDDLRKTLMDQKSKPGDFARLLEFAGKPGMRIAWLAGKPPASSSSGTLFWDTEQRRYLLVGAFSPAPPGKDYQLWFVTSESKVSAGLIKANPDGPTCTTAPISNDLPHVTVVGITLEPEGGSPSPTTPFWTLGRFN